MTVSCRPMGWDPMVRENICTQAAGRTLAASLWTAYLKMIKTAKRQKLSRSSTEHLPWSVKQEKQTSRRKRYWRCGREVKPIIEEFYNFIGALRLSKGSHLGAAVTYALNQKDKLLLFLDHPEVEMTNNLAERTVKPFVIDRKNFLFSATDKGADASALFMSVIETAKRNGLNVFGYLSYLMLVLPSWGKTPSEEQLDSIMPWSATLPETCHRTYHQIVENMAEVK